MLSYAAQEVFKQGEIDAFHRARAIFKELPYEWEGELLRCHEVARIVHVYLQHEGVDFSEVVDGKYGPVDHSWIYLDRSRRVVLDTYAVGQLPAVRLLDSWMGLGKMYELGKGRDDIRLEVIRRFTRDLRRNRT